MYKQQFIQQTFFCCYYILFLWSFHDVLNMNKIITLKYMGSISGLKIYVCVWVCVCMSVYYIHFDKIIYSMRVTSDSLEIINIQMYNTRFKFFKFVFIFGGSFLLNNDEKMFHHFVTLLIIANWINTEPLKSIWIEWTLVLGLWTIAN